MTKIAFFQFPAFPHPNTKSERLLDADVIKTEISSAEIQFCFLKIQTHTVFIFIYYKYTKF